MKKNIIIVLLQLISFGVYSQTAYLYINNVNVGASGYTHPIANQTVSLRVPFNVAGNRYINTSSVMLTLYKNGVAVPAADYYSTVVVTLYQQDYYGNTVPTNMEANFTLNCYGYPFGAGEYYVKVDMVYNYLVSNPLRYVTNQEIFYTPRGVVDVQPDAPWCGSFSGSNALYQQNITNSAICSLNLLSGSNTNLTAGTSIFFKPGFTAAPGSTMTAQIGQGFKKDACSSS